MEETKGQAGRDGKQEVKVTSPVVQVAECPLRVPNNAQPGESRIVCRVNAVVRDPFAGLRKYGSGAKHTLEITPSAPGKRPRRTYIRARESKLSVIPTFVPHRAIANDAMVIIANKNGRFSFSIEAGVAILRVPAHGPWKVALISRGIIAPLQRTLWGPRQRYSWQCTTHWEINFAQVKAVLDAEYRAVLKLALEIFNVRVDPMSIIWSYYSELQRLPTND